MSEQPQARFTPLGRLISILMIAGLIAAGVYMIRGGSDRSSGDGKSTPGGSGKSDAPSGPDTLSPSPGRAPDRRTGAPPPSTVPVTATVTTKAGPPDTPDAARQQSALDALNSSP